MPSWVIATSPPNLIQCGINAYAQLKSLARFTSLIKISSPSNTDSYALVDTGAERSCISSAHFNDLRSRDSSLFLFNFGVTLNTANGSSLQVMGTACIEIPLTFRLSVTADLFVCPNLTHNIIIGLDILLSTRALIDLHEQSITFRSPDPSVSPQTTYFVTTPTPPNHLTIAKDITINPRQQHLVDVCCQGLPGNHPDNGGSTRAYFIEDTPVFSSERPVIVARGIAEVDLSLSPHCRILITNPTNASVSLIKGYHIANITPFDISSVSRVGTLHIAEHTQTFRPSPITPQSVPHNLSASPPLSPPPDLRFSEDFQDYTPLQSPVTPQISPTLSPLERQQLLSLLKDNWHLFSENPDAPSIMRGIPPVHIDTGSVPPQHAPAYRRHPLAHKYIDEKVHDMLRQGLIELSSSGWSFPVVLALKPNGKLRFCIDYRRLNAVTKQDAYALPRLDDILDSMHGNVYFTTLDAASGFHQIPLDDSSKPKTAFSTKSGHYQWTRLPFGWINAPANFQRTIDFILHGLTFICALVYMDDIIVFSKSFKDHLYHLQLIFDRLTQYSCQLRLEKCCFAATSINYLGHVVSSRGIQTKPALVQAIRNFPSPQNASSPSAAKSAIKSFVALANFYRRFIKRFSLIADPLLSLLRKRSPFIWTESHRSAFETLKLVIAT